MPVLAAASIALLVFVEAGGCTYDFEAPFEETGLGGASAAGGTSGGGSGANGGSMGGSGGTSAGGSGGTNTGGTGGTSTGGAGGTDVGGSGGQTGGSAGTAGLGGTGGTGGSTIVDGHDCSVVDPNGTGDELNGIIPVCCIPSVAEKQDLLELFALLNEHRAANSVPELTYDLDLEATIQAHLIHQVLHPFDGWTAPESVVVDSSARAALCGTATTGGVSGTNHPTAASAMDSWKTNATINDNMLDTKHHRAGAARYANRWAVEFGP